VVEHVDVGEPLLLLEPKRGHRSLLQQQTQNRGKTVRSLH
jgi:hypothetical protein